METFFYELKERLNLRSKENGSNTPDFILAEYLLHCLDIFDKMVQSRDAWYGVHLEPGNKYFNIQEKSSPSFSTKIEECKGDCAALSAEEFDGMHGVGSINTEEIEKAR